MKHLGDICKINGAEVTPVSVIIGGSPCQDLSVAGKRAGLDGERSGLFMEQIRLVKEMRENDKRSGRTDEFIRPRYMVWENVPGAFSSNKGEDFRVVLEETARVADKSAVIPKSAKWTPSGCIMGDGWSIAWRVHDAQFWGVPQRRKRIALVADFGGKTAPEILFERKSLSRDIEKSEEERKDTSADIEGSTRTAIGVERERCGAIVAEELSPTIQAAAGTSGNNQPMVCHALSFQERGGKPGGGKGILIQDERTGALKTGQNQSVCAVGFPLGFRPENTKAYEEKATTLCNGTRPGFTTGVVYAVDQGAGKSSCNYEEEKSPTLACTHDGSPAVLVENHPQDSRVKLREDGICQTLDARMGMGGGNVPMVMQKKEPILLESNQNHATIQTDGVSTTLPASMGMGGGYVPMVTSWDGGQISPTLTSRNAGGAQRMPDKENFNAVITTSHGGYMINADDGDKAHTLQATDYKDPQVVSYGLDRASFNQGENAKFNFSVEEEKIGAQLAKGPGAVFNRIVRRLTPLECERLQGFPDGWTDIGDWVDSNGKTHKGDSDSPRYKALGNSIALPFWEWMLKRMMQYLDEKTMASLFDGIGGFPLVWNRNGGKTLWASEIEEFPIAVTKRRFGDE